MARRRREPEPVYPMPLEQVVGQLARRTNDLFITVAKLETRLATLEDTLDDVRKECARLVRQVAQAMSVPPRAAPPRRRRGPRLLTVAVAREGSTANGHAPTLARVLRSIA
jgi:hypothetical protein